jgi:hypothetical protein
MLLMPARGGCPVGAVWLSRLLADELHLNDDELNVRRAESVME